VTISEAAYLPAAVGTAAHARLIASHDGYHWLPGAPRHQRTWRLDADGARIDDLITGHGRHRVEVLFHLTPGITAHADAESVLFGRPGDPSRAYTLRAAGGSGWRTEARRVATAWGRTEPAVVAIYETVADLPVRLHTSVGRWRPPAQTGPSALVTGPGKGLPEPEETAHPAERPHA
jgi:hypothetical protein